MNQLFLDILLVFIYLDNLSIHLISDISAKISILFFSFNLDFPAFQILYFPYLFDSIEFDVASDVLDVSL